VRACIKTELERGMGLIFGDGEEFLRSFAKDCTLAKEASPEPRAEAYCYTTFIHLRDIFEKQ